MNIWPQLAMLGATYLVIDGVLLAVWGLAAQRVLGRLIGGTGLLNKVSGGLMIAAAGLLAMRDAQLR